MRSVAGIAWKDGCVFIAKRDGSGDLAGKWEFPGGKVEPGERDEDALRREFAEEFGLTIEVGDHLASADFVHNGSVFELHAYLVHLPEADPRPIECHTDAAWIPLQRIASLDFADSDLKLLPELTAALL
jgi:mutator protein MutT